MRHAMWTHKLENMEEKFKFEFDDVDCRLNRRSTMKFTQHAEDSKPIKMQQDHVRSHQNPWMKLKLITFDSQERYFLNILKWNILVNTKNINEEIF